MSNMKKGAITYHGIFPIGYLQVSYYMLNEYLLGSLHTFLLLMVLLTRSYEDSKTKLFKYVIIIITLLNLHFIDETTLQHYI